MSESLALSRNPWRWRRTSCCWVLAAVLVSGCSDRVLNRRLSEEPEDTVVLITADAGTVLQRELDTDPHAVLGVSPTHGPFQGGGLAVIRGNGFTSEARIWFGDEEVPAEDVTPLDPNRVQVRVPPGSPGPVDVSVQIDDDTSTQRILTEGYEYDAFAVAPGVGTTAGGTVVTLTGSGTDWDDETQVFIDLEPCQVLEIRDADGDLQELDCRTPEGTPGAKVITTVTDEDEYAVTGGFTYSESVTNFEGGIAGAPLEDALTVTVFDDLFGERLAGVHVFLGDGTREDRATRTDDTGTATFSGELGPHQTVTVAGDCIQPITVVDVPTDTLTLYVDPLLIPACLPPSLDLPRFGGSAGAAPVHFLKGALSWGTGIELRQTNWTNVPLPVDDTEEQVAYVFELSSDSRSRFRLPSSFEAVTLEDKGTIGFEFDMDTRSTGNLTLYALAGIERTLGGDREFTPYAMGLVQGVDATDEEQYPVIEMNVVLDHALGVDVAAPPTAVEGPDRVQLDLLLRVGRAGFIPLPHTSRTELLPLGDTLEFIGVPPLVKALSGAEYIVTARAVTGASEQLPVADVEALATKSTDRAVSVDRFIGVPQLDEPVTGEQWSGMDVEFAPVAGDYDVWVLDIDADDGVFSWRVVLPGDRMSVELPDLEPFESQIPRGPVTITVSAARIANFDYANLRQRDFGAGGWAAYSSNRVTTHLP